MKRVVIVNADDLGLSREINEGVLSSLERGLVSDVSLLVRAPFAREATDRLREMGLTGVGLHLDLDALLGWSSPGREAVPRSELEARFGDPIFIERLREDVRIQVESFIDLGLAPVHLDTHHHVHGFFPIFLEVLELARRYRIPAMRYSGTGYTLTTREPIPFDPHVYQRMEELMRGQGVFSCSAMVEGAGRIGDVRSFPAELVVHPSRAGDPWRSRELETLASEPFRHTLAAGGMELAGYRDLVDRMPGIA